MQTNPVRIKKLAGWDGEFGKLLDVDKIVDAKYNHDRCDYSRRRDDRKLKNLRSHRKGFFIPVEPEPYNVEDSVADLFYNYEEEMVVSIPDVLTHYCECERCACLNEVVCDIRVSGICPSTPWVTLHLCESCEMHGCPNYHTCEVC